MGFWSGLGKIALSAAPYIAAPFTGGASLFAVPAANKAVGAWSQHDAEQNAAQGLAPSSFDKILGTVDNYAGLAAGGGLLGKALGGFGGSGNPGYASEGSNGVIPGMMNAASPLLNSLGGGGGGRTNPNPSQTVGQAVPRPQPADMSNSGLGPSNAQAMMSGMMQNTRAPNIQNALDFGANQGYSELQNRQLPWKPLSWIPQ